MVIVIIIFIITSIIILLMHMHYPLHIVYMLAMYFYNVDSNIEVITFYHFGLKSYNRMKIVALAGQIS